MTRLVLATVAVTAALGCGTVTAAAASGTQLTTPLPEATGAQGLAVNGADSFVVYADTPRGHAAAISSRTGQVAWRAATARGATLVAATPAIVWTAATGLGGSLVAQDAATGRTLRTFVAPGNGGWQTLASDGGTLYALGYSADETHQTITTFVGARRTRIVSTDVPQACNSVAGAGSLYLACFHSVDTVYRLDPRTGAVLAHSAPAGLDGGADLAYRHGSLYFTTSAQTNAQPTVVNRVSASTLRPQSRSAAADIVGIAAAGPHVLALQSDDQSTGHVLDLNPTSLKVASSIAIQSPGYPYFVAAAGRYAYVVQVTAYAGPGLPDETLVRISLPAR